MVDSVILAIPVEVTEQAYLFLLGVTEALLPHEEMFQLVKETLELLLSVVLLQVPIEMFHVQREVLHAQSHHPGLTNPAVLPHLLLAALPQVVVLVAVASVVEALVEVPEVVALAVAVEASVEVPEVAALAAVVVLVEADADKQILN